MNISFLDGGKWRFSDGNSTFYADILDYDFLERVKRNEVVFAKDDILIVNLKRKQSLIEGTIKAEYSVVKVIRNRSAAVQIRLPFSSEK